MEAHQHRRDTVARMTRAWRGLRRGPSTIALSNALFGSGEGEVEAAHMDVLDLLAEQSSWRMSELAAVLKVDPSTVTRTVQRMEADGLVARRPDPVDGRVVAVAMTPDGRQRHADVAALRATIVGRVMDAFDLDEQRQLTELNERFLVSLDEVIADVQANGHAPQQDD